MEQVQITIDETFSSQFPQSVFNLKTLGEALYFCEEKFNTLKAENRALIASKETLEAEYELFQKQVQKKRTEQTKQLKEEIDNFQFEAVSLKTQKNELMEQMRRTKNEWNTFVTKFKHEIEVRWLTK